MFGGPGVAGALELITHRVKELVLPPTALVGAQMHQIVSRQQRRTRDAIAGKGEGATGAFETAALQYEVVLAGFGDFGQYRLYPVRGDDVASRLGNCVHQCAAKNRVVAIFQNLGIGVEFDEEVVTDSGDGCRPVPDAAETGR